MVPYGLGQPLGFGGEEGVRDLREHAAAVAGVLVGAHRAAVVEVLQDLEAHGHDGVRGAVPHVGHEADAAGVVLVRGVVKALGGRQAGVARRHHGFGFGHARGDVRRAGRAGGRCWADGVPLVHGHGTMLPRCTEVAGPARRLPPWGRVAARRPTRPPRPTPRNRPAAEMRRRCPKSVSNAVLFGAGLGCRKRAATQWLFCPLRGACGRPQRPPRFPSRPAAETSAGTCDTGARKTGRGQGTRARRPEPPRSTSRPGNGPRTGRWRPRGR